MKVIYQTNIVDIGDCASDALADGMMIMFKQGAPASIVDFCFIHNHSQCEGELAVGNQLQIANENYTLTAIGEVATENLRELGHLTIRFDGASTAELPGSIHVSGSTPQTISLGTTIRFIA